MAKLIEDHKSEEAQRVTDAMMKMKKLDIAELKHAYEGDNVKQYS